MRNPSLNVEIGTHDTETEHIGMASSDISITSPKTGLHWTGVLPWLPWESGNKSMLNNDETSRVPFALFSFYHDKSNTYLQVTLL